MEPFNQWRAFSSDRMSKYSIFLNPLMLPEVDMRPGVEFEIPAEAILHYLTAPEVDSSTASFVKRYQDAFAIGDRIHFAPADAEILDRLIWPLRNAQGSYALGNLNAGTKVVVGTGQSAECSQYLTYPASAAQQIYIEDASSSTCDCRNYDALFSWQPVSE